MSQKYNYIIIGSGIIGLTLAHSLKRLKPSSSILIIDKEDHEAYHASSRNSGVLHAGFYYTSDSLKAKLTVDGNRRMRAYCQEKSLPINPCGKLVIATNEEEVRTLYELERRGRANGSNICIIDEAQAKQIEPNVKTFKKALYSPDTASVDPKQVCLSIKDDLLKSGVEIKFNTEYKNFNKDSVVETSKGSFETDKLINCAGLYADKIAHKLNFGRQYTILPFKGIYLKYTKNKTDVKINIYPVPNLKNPFLGVHFTKTVQNEIKIGPTAIPAFWRENYHSYSRFKLGEFFQIFGLESKLFVKNSFGFRDLAFEEMKKYSKDYMIKQSQAMVNDIDPAGFTEYTAPGIRAQLFDRQTEKLVSDFIVEGDEKSIHILNAVSPAFTCSFPFSEYVISKYNL